MTMPHVQEEQKFTTAFAGGAGSQQSQAYPPIQILATQFYLSCSDQVRIYFRIYFRP